MKVTLAAFIPRAPVQFRTKDESPAFFITCQLLGSDRLQLVSKAIRRWPSWLSSSTFIPTRSPSGKHTFRTDDPPQSGGHLNKLGMAQSKIADDHAADMATLMLIACFYRSF
jgi:hypothetical protein